MKIAVIGGGASGIIAAIFAKKTNSSADVTVFERSDRILKKIPATGNGRCNLSNADIGTEFYFSHSEKNLSKILSAVSKKDIAHFFESMGIMLSEDEGRIYPYSKRANAVSDALRFEAERLGIELKCNKLIKVIKRHSGHFIIDNCVFDSVIISAGGAAAPTFGTDGNAFILMKSLGHMVQKPSPALSPIKTLENTKAIKGIRVLCSLSLLRDSKELRKESGELQITDYGISGIAVMQLSRQCRKGDKISIDFLPNMTSSEALEYLKSRAKVLDYRKCEDFLTGVLHKALAVYIMTSIGIKPALPVSKLDNEGLVLITKALKGFQFTVDSVLGWQNAQVTCGGASLDEFSPSTLESVICPGLYCTGEALDCVGDCGGYNLHWAWVTGIIAGISAADR